METKIDIHLINKSDQNHINLNTVLFLSDHCFYFGIDHKKTSAVGDGSFFKLICGLYASLQQAANDYFFAAKRAAASSQFTTFQNSLM